LNGEKLDMSGRSNDPVKSLRLRNEFEIQAYLDSIPYNTEHANLCPGRVVEERRANCFDGALFGAAALQLMGDPPIILELVPNSRDDEHLVALFRRNGCWGAVAKSNFVGLRFRTPVYRSLRELVMSYFEGFFNEVKEKTLRGYKRPLDLRVFRNPDWINSDDALVPIMAKLERRQAIHLLTPAMIRKLSLVDERTYDANMQGADPDGLYHVGSSASISPGS
jgi:hypothetical protein